MATQNKLIQVPISQEDLNKKIAEYLQSLYQRGKLKQIESELLNEINTSLLIRPKEFNELVDQIIAFFRGNYGDIINRIFANKREIENGIYSFFTEKKKQEVERLLQEKSAEN